MLSLSNNQVPLSGIDMLRPETDHERKIKELI
jgi:hypothetical protein